MKITPFGTAYITGIYDFKIFVATNKCKHNMFFFPTDFVSWVVAISYTMKCMCPSAPVTITSIQMRMASADGATM